MKQLTLTLSAALLTCAVFAQHKNVLITNVSLPNEPSIMFNPKQPKYMVAGANLSNYFYSSDSGKTWTAKTLTSSYGVWGDPTMIVDTTGAFYFFHLSNPSTGNWIDRIVCQKSTDKGQTYNDGSYMGLNGTKAQDKQWIDVDRKRNIMYSTWTQFDAYGSTAATDSSHILFSRSTDGGATWSAAKRLDLVGGDCIDDDNTVEGAVPAVGPRGEVYVVWAAHQKLYFTKSLNGGSSFARPKVIGTQPGGWTYDIEGIQRCNGLPVTVCDCSNGPNKGTIYVNWTDQRNGAANTDVWLIKSTDGGKTWSQPIKVNNDNTTRQQFLTWMSVDNVTGYLYFVFYDRRNTTGNATDVYMARSKDGGKTFTNFKISETSFTPNAFLFFGDYTNLYAYNNVVRPIWCRMDRTTTSIYTALVNTSVIGKTTEPVAVQEQNTAAAKEEETDNETAVLSAYPNPFSSVTYVSFAIHENTKVSVDIFDNNGKLVLSPIKNKEYSYGKYVEEIDFSKYDLPAGTYYMVITGGEEPERRKIIYTK